MDGAPLSWFNQNFSENYLLEPILAGEVALPAPNVREPFVDADDIADAAVAALTDDKHAGQLYELTGPRLLTFADAIARPRRQRAEKFATCRCRWTNTSPRSSKRSCRRNSWG